MNRHVHVHVMMTAGGLSLDEESWNPIQASDPAMRPEKLAAAFKKTYLRRLNQKLKAGELDWSVPAASPAGAEVEEPVDESDRLTVVKFLEDVGVERVAEVPVATAVEAEQTEPLAYLSDRDLQRITSKDWVVDVQQTPPQYRGAEGVINYLAGYMSGTAIGDGRLISDDGTHVTIRIKDYRNNRPGTEVMTGEEFVRRHVDHILPKGIRRVRYVGLFGSSRRSERLAICRPLIAAYNEAHHLRLSQPTVDEAGAEKPELGPSSCRQCHAKMKFAQRLKGDVMEAIISASAKLLVLLLEQSDCVDQTPAERFDAIFLSHRMSLRLWYFRGDDLTCLKVFTLAALDAELARLEAEAEQDIALPHANPPPISVSGVSDAA